MEASKKLFWFAHLERITRERISCAQYARRESLNLKQLYSWKYKFGLHQIKQSGHQSVALKAGRVAPSFVAVRVSKSTPVELMNLPSVPHHCHLRLASGTQVEFSALPPAAWLASLELTLRTGGVIDARR